jgi:hypothetical protein
MDTLTSKRQRTDAADAFYANPAIVMEIMTERDELRAQLTAANARIARLEDIIAQVRACAHTTHQHLVALFAITE